jgi:hypothetical protein
VVLGVVYCACNAYPNRLCTACCVVLGVVYCACNACSNRLCTACCVVLGVVYCVPTFHALCCALCTVCCGLSCVAALLCCFFLWIMCGCVAVYCGCVLLLFLCAVSSVMYREQLFFRLLSYFSETFARNAILCAFRNTATLLKKQKLDVRAEQASERLAVDEVCLFLCLSLSPFPPPFLSPSSLSLSDRRSSSSPE